jgi:ABC-type uncharacterized transport system substrate-binding protein
MKRANAIILLYLCCLLAAIPVLASPAVARVMVVHSYGSNHICGKPQGDGVAQALADAGWKQGENLEMRSVYMDTKKTYTTPEAIHERGQLALKAIEEFDPQVVVVLDDNAIREVLLPLVDRKGISLVFSGMNGQPADYAKKADFLRSLAKPGHNVTGVYEKLYLLKSLRVMAAAIGNLKPGDKVVGITDYSPTGNAITRQFEIELAGHTPKLGWELRRVKNFEEYKALINSLNKEPHVRAIYPAALKLETADGQTYTAGQIFAWTTANSAKPEMALNYYFSKIGLFGGAAVDFTAMGYQAGKMAARILSGTKAGDIPIEDASDYAIVFNQKRAKSLGIDIPKPLLTAADQVYKSDDK